MKNKYIIYNIIATLIALVLMFIFGIEVTKDNNIKKTEDEIIRLTNVYALGYNSVTDYNKNIDSDIRVTVIDAKGKVIADSKEDYQTMDNHLDRQEIIAALQGKPETCIRKSDTTNADMIYYALKVDLESTYVFMRISMQVSSINDYVVSTISSMVFILFLSLIISTVISYLLSTKILKPLELVRENLNNINNGKYGTTLPTTKDADINKILIEINDVGDKLNNNILALKETNNKLDYVLNNISSGIVVFNANEVIELMNSSALTIFDIKDYENKTISYLSMDLNFVNKVKNIIKTESSEIFDFSFNGSYCVCSINKLQSDLFILVINDITEIKNSENIRSEFFANASHELKTPLTSIKGFNEIVMMKNKDQTLVKYLENIERETNRILLLLDDMLKLSKLENTHQVEKENVNLLEVASEVLDELQLLKESKKVDVTIEGSANIFGEKEHFHELLKNLIENGIKYNNENGFVKIKLTDKTNTILIEVIDNGLGIDKSDQNRIFERFYRVNKSRSRNSGGTGLGLSIVKHIVQIYDGSISLSSSIGNGTTIKMVFNKNVNLTRMN